MACLTYVPDLQDVLVSTTGSLDSGYVKMTREMLPHAIEVVRNSQEHKTYIFEICHPSDPHIVPENVGAYLIGSRWVNDKSPYFSNLAKEKILDTIATKMQVIRPRYFQDQFLSIVNQTKHVEHEGYVVYGQSSRTVLKLKSPHYLSLKAMVRKKDILSLSKHKVDEEYYPLLDHLISLGPKFNEIPEQERLAYIRSYLTQ